MSSPTPSSSPAPPAADSPPPSTPPPTVTPSAPPPSTPSSPPPSSPPPSSPPPSTPTPAASPPPPDVSPPPTSTPPAASASPPPPSTPTPSTPSPPPPSGRDSSPPPPATTSPPPPPPPPSSSSSSSNGISTGAVVGIAIGGVVILLVLSLICIFCSKKKKKRRNEYGGEGYYVPPPPQHPGPKDGYYGAPPQQQWQQNNPPPPQQHWQQNNPPPPQQHMMQPRPNGPSPPAPAPAAGSWRPPSPKHPPTPPPPQQPFMSSSGGSVSSYPGSEVALPPPSPGMSLGFTKSTFTYEELAMATDNFSDANILGQGGFGYVHKGILPNGKEVAVKALKAGSGQGEREFRAEVEIISRVHHKHLVSLVGYCITGSQRMLVYEFVPNNNLEFHLHGKGRPVMEWPVRLRIALGAAKGLSYLHEDCHPKIIHRDIKASNILLDFKFEAKVADFGLAKISSDINTHVSTRVMGTFGYLAPEYAASGKLTDKSDVFSFGVMLLELITGRRPVDTANAYMDDSLVDWARPTLTRALEEDNFDSLVDPKLRNNYNHNEMARMVACAAACVRHSARRRPRMGQIVRALEGDVSLSDLNEGVRPGHSSIYGSSYGSSDYDNNQYKEDMKKFRQVALASQEYGSSEYGGTTSEYGLYQSGTSSEQTTREMEMGKIKKDSRGGLPKDSRGFSGSSDV